MQQEEADRERDFKDSGDGVVVVNGRRIGMNDPDEGEEEDDDGEPV